MDKDAVTFVGAVLAMLALPITALVKAVSIAKDVESNRHDAEVAIQAVRTETLAAVSAHEKLCEERMRSMLYGNEQILTAITRISERIDSM